MNPIQMLRLFKSFVSMLFGDESLQAVGKMSDALVETPAFDLAAQHLGTCQKIEYRRF